MTPVRMWVAGGAAEDVGRGDLAGARRDRGRDRSTGRCAGGARCAALVVALALQVGVNYANDYSDGVRGTDANRRGPVRLVASGLASPAAVRNAAVVVVRRRGASSARCSRSS